MKIFVVFKVARQIQGEFVMVQTLRAFKEASKAEEFSNKISKTATELVDTPDGKVECFCEVGIHDVLLEENDG
jgi:hypothetical protein